MSVHYEPSTVTKANRAEVRKRILDAWRKNPDMTGPQLAARFGVNVSVVQRALKEGK